MTLIDPRRDPELIFGGIWNLLGPNSYNGQTFRVTAQGDDATWGNPVPIDTWVSSQLQDGSVAFTQGHDNREMFLRVKIRADDAAGLQAGEDAIFSACNRRTTLLWTPPAPDHPSSVFEVFTSHLEHAFEGDEERATARTYGLRFVAAPFARSEDQITLEATPDGVAFSETVIDECTSTTNWTAGEGGTLTLVSSQAVRNTIVLGPGRPVLPRTISLTRSAAFTTTDDYIRVKGSVSTGETLKLTVDGTDYEAVATSGAYTWFAVPAGSYTTVVVYAESYATPSPWTLTVWSLYETNTTSLGSRRELQRTFTDIKGSARTPGKLTISHASNGLGDVLAFVYPADLGDYAPPLQPFYDSGGTQTPLTTNVSGTSEPVNGTPTWVVPSTALPAGAYHFYARLRHTTSNGVFSVTVSAEVAGTTVTETINIKIDATNTWQMVAIVTLHLPPLRLIDTADQDVTIDLTWGGGANLEMDTAWLFLADEYDRRTALISVAAGSELSMTYRVADAENPSDVVYIGDHAAGENLQAADTPTFKPPNGNLYIVTTGTEDAEAELDYYPRGHTHMGQ